MGSPKTRPTTGQRWPRNAEEQRAMIVELAEGGQKLLDQQRKLLDQANDKLIENPRLAEILLARAIIRAADIQSLLWQIQHLATLARVGPEPKPLDTTDTTDE